MLTDEDLTTELRAAFHGATDHLSYDARVRLPRRTPWLVAPVAVAAAIGVPMMLGAGPTPTPSIPIEIAPTATLSAGLVTDSFHLAGYKLTYQRRADEQPVNQLSGSGECAPDHVPTGNPYTETCYLLWEKVVSDGVPKDATPVQITGAGEAWVGKDPDTGITALYLTARTDEGKQIFAMLSKTRTPQQLVDLANSMSAN